MKIISKAILTILMLLLFCNVFAQVSLGPKIGLSYSKLGGDYTNSKFMPGSYFFGAMFNIKFYDYFSFQNGMLLSGKGTTLRYSDTDDDEIIITYLEFPFNNIFTMPAGAGHIQFIAGPYIGYAINGRYRYLEDDGNLMEKITIGDEESDELKPFDLGINLGMGYLYEGLEVQVAYSRSLTNISNLPHEKLFNNVVTLSFAYYFDTNYKR